MEWNVKNALSRDVERQHLNKILAEIRSTVDSVQRQSAQPTDNVRDIVGTMVEGNTEEGMSVTYDAAAGVLDFAVNSFIITLAGDITGSGTVSALRNVTITTTIDPDKVGIPDAPIDNHAYWRLNGEWSQVADSILGLSDLRDEGFISQSYDDAEGEVLWAVRTFEAASGELTITNPTGLGGNPLYGLADLPDSGVGTSPVQLFTRDAKGRVEGTEDASTDDLPEGITNLYFTEERAQDAVGAIMADTSDIDLTYTDGTPSIEASLTASVHDSLALADSAIQPGDNVSELVNDAGYVDAGGAQTAVVTGTITDGDTTHAPSGDAVFDALALKQDADQSTSGQYTPTVTPFINIASCSGLTFNWTRTDSAFVLSGSVQATATAINSAAAVTISLPISTTFGADANVCGGVAACKAAGVPVYESGQIFATASASTLTALFYPTSANLYTIRFTVVVPIM